MTEPERDRGLDELLHLDGVVLVVDPSCGHWVKFVVKKVERSPERPHGVSYSLTLHAADGQRLVGFDNAHAVTTGAGPGRRTREAHDHRHRRGAASPYEYRDAATLLLDFWNEVDAALRTRGIIP